MAKDEDVGLNALIKYRLKHDLFGNYKSFMIEENSGLITLKVALNREKQKLYEVKNTICYRLQYVELIRRDLEQVKI